MKQPKYKREWGARDDKQQLVFSADGDLKSNEFKFAKVEEKKIDFTKKVTCPFCLSWLPLSKFIISTKEGYNQGLGKCSECGCGMRLKTLFALGKWSPEEYAKFVVEYPYGKFWAKINSIFLTWKDRLELMGWTEKFWKEYHRLNPRIDDKATAEEEGLYAAASQSWDNEKKG